MYISEHVLQPLTCYEQMIRHIERVILRYYGPAAAPKPPMRLKLAIARHSSKTNVESAWLKCSADLTRLIRASTPNALPDAVANVCMENHKPLGHVLVDQPSKKPTINRHRLGRIFQVMRHHPGSRIAMIGTSYSGVPTCEPVEWALFYHAYCKPLSIEMTFIIKEHIDWIPKRQV